MLQLINLEKTFATGNHQVKALDDVSLEVGRGDIVVINGRSGCGKTTLLLTAGGLLLPDSGTVTLDGVDLYAVSGEERARQRADKLGFVFQQFHLLPYLNVLENVLVPTIGRGPARQTAEELLHRFDLADRLDHKPAELSTGERQRTALVRALINGPGILLADEPTGNLDDDNAAAVMEYMARFAEEGGGILLVSHDRRTAQHARKMHVMSKGQLLPAAANN